MSASRILLACDKPGILSHIKELLENHSYRVETADNEEAVLQSLNHEAPDLLLLDMVMAGMNGLRALERCKKIRPQQKVVMISCGSEASDIVQAVKLGAEDFITSPFHPRRFQAVVGRLLGPATGSPAPASNDAAGIHVVDNLDNDLFFLAASPAMRQIRAQAALVAKVDMPVLLLGESGVGKEIIARLIHRLSPRVHGTLLKINCAALPAELLESELFGYEAGAFTGATRSKPGKFELCHKGTMLLDEIGEMSPGLQAKLLHVLQDGQCSRLGGKADLSVDVRIIAATNIDIEMAIGYKAFREDLYYRLNAFTVKVPPLRERKEEIPVLLTHFMNSQAAKLGKPVLPVSDRLLQACLHYRWPGNLRELANVVKRYLVLEDENLIIEGLPPANGAVSGDGHKTIAFPGDLKGLVGELRDETELREIRRALEVAQWNRRVAAAQLKISYRTLLHKMKRYGLYPPPELRKGWLHYG